MQLDLPPTPPIPAADNAPSLDPGKPTAFTRKPPRHSVGMGPLSSAGPLLSPKIRDSDKMPLEKEQIRAKYLAVINHEFRSLQLDKLLTTMSVFDLIDHCASLFEELTNNVHTATGARLYVRLYLIFNYFVNTFIMMHFNGFAKFMETSYQDFIIYLNLYNFYRSDDILGLEPFDVDPPILRDWILHYLDSKNLLTFDVVLLYGWLDEYIEYLCSKDADPLELQMGQNGHEEQRPHVEQSNSPDDDLFDFNTRFPEIAPKTNGHRTTSLIHFPSSEPGDTPYPVAKPANSHPVAKPPNPYPVAIPKNPVLVMRPQNLHYSRMSMPLPPIPRAQARPPSNGRPLHNSPMVNQPQYMAPHPLHVPSMHLAMATPYNFPAGTPHQYQSQPPQGYTNGQRANPHRQPQYIEKPRNSRKALSICGMKNLGSSCYINLTVQTLIGLTTFTNELLHRKKPMRPLPLSDSLAGLVLTFNSNGGNTIAPTKFLRTLSSLKPDFNIPFEQQDAQEFLLFLLDKLHEEQALKPTRSAIDYLNKWNITVNPRDKDEYLKWYTELLNHEGESFINDTFQGHVQSKLVCNTCQFKSISYSPFTILSLPIPAGNNQAIDLTDCLRFYTQDEVLTGENAWNCPKCNKTSEKENVMDVVFQPKRGLFLFSKRSKSPNRKNEKQPPNTSISIKQLSFIKLPPVMFIHLSRFSMMNGTDKLSTVILYPLRLKFNHQTHDIFYSLTGIINHYGTLKSGHYTALVNKAHASENQKDVLRDPNWVFFDDEAVQTHVKHGDVDSPDQHKLHSRDVYVLCYERV